MTSIASSGSAFQSLQSQLASGVSSGKIKSNDQNALSSALSDIDSSLQSSGLNGAAPSKSTIDSLISQQVQSGKLTADQADELQEVFGSFATSNSASTSSLSDVQSKSSTNNSTLNQFLKSLKDSSASAYNASGTTSGSITALLVNIKT